MFLLDVAICFARFTAFCFLGGISSGKGSFRCGFSRVTILVNITGAGVDVFSGRSMYHLKEGYLEKISQEAKKTKSNQVDVRFEEINKEDIPFQAEDIVPLLVDFMTGIKTKRKKREQKSVITEKDNFHRRGFLTFIQVVWMELGN